MWQLRWLSRSRFQFLALNVPQVRFSLSSAPIFSRTDTVTDSEGFYTSILSLLDDPDEVEEVTNLLAWWDRSVQWQAPPSPN
jgi:hypothetical protein